MQSTLTIGFTSYRLEMLPLVEAAARGHDLFLLEEPHTPGFEEMLKGEKSPEEYILLTDFEFPEYAKQACEMLRRLHSQGMVVVQCDPYMDQLVSIQEFFASGGSPDLVEEESVAGFVYACERDWTSRLLSFYSASRRRSFEEIVDSVVEFSRRDAARGLMRNRMRAEAIADLCGPKSRVYIEAGYIHSSLVDQLRAKSTGAFAVHPLHLSAEVCAPRIGRRYPPVPGDVLTFVLTRRQNARGQRLRLLAARSLVYNKLILKDEFSPQPGSYPHLEDEMEIVGLVNALSFDECRRFFGQLKGKSTQDARKAVRGALQ